MARGCDLAGRAVLRALRVSEDDGGQPREDAVLVHGLSVVLLACGRAR